MKLKKIFFISGFCIIIFLLISCGENKQKPDFTVSSNITNGNIQADDTITIRVNSINKNLSGISFEIKSNNKVREIKPINLNSEINSEYKFLLNNITLCKKELFIKANELLIQQLELFKNDLKNISNKEDSRMSIEKIEENIYTLFVYGSDDTIGNIIQYDISNIDEDSDLIVCGYKKIHPLEDIITFNISLKQKNKTNEQNIIKIIDIFTESVNNLIDIYNTIKSEATKNL